MTPPLPARPARRRSARWALALGAAVVGTVVVGGLVAKSGGSGWRVSGVVEAPPDGVWRALLEETPALSGAERRAIARHDPSRPLVLREPGAEEARTEVDGRRRTLTVQGEWWYRGTTSVEPRGKGVSLVAHRVENVAPGAGRWIARLVQGPGVARGMEDGHRRLLDAIGRRLGAKSRLLDE